MATQIVSGMDLDKLEAFRAALRERTVILGLGAHGVWEGHSGRSTVHIGPYELGGERIDRETRHYTIPYGAWKEVEEAIGFVGPVGPNTEFPAVMLVDYVRVYQKQE